MDRLDLHREEEEMKKLFSLLSVLAVAVALVGCEPAATTPAAKPAANGTPPAATAPADEKPADPAAAPADEKPADAPANP